MFELEIPFKDHKYDANRIRYNGLVHLEGLYTMVRTWFSTHKFKFIEKKLKHTYGSKGLSNEIEWIGVKSVYDYLKLEVTIIYKTRDVIDVEVLRDGQKEKLQQVRLLIEIKGKTTYDPRKYVDKGTLLGHNLKALYHRIMKKKFIFYWEAELENLIKELHKKCITYLNFESTVTL